MSQSLISSAQQAWRNLTGRPSPIWTEVRPRGLPALERSSLELLFSDGAALSRRGFNRNLAAAEGMSILSGTTERAFISRVAPVAYKNFFKGRTNVEYAERIGDQLDIALEKLSDDPHSRQAIMYIGRSTVADDDPPCTESVQLLLRNGILRLHVNMRSWDLYLGLPYDVAMWQIVAQALAYHRFGGIRSEVSFYCPAPHFYLRDLQKPPRDLMYTAIRVKWNPRKYSMEDALKVGIEDGRSPIEWRQW